MDETRLGDSLYKAGIISKELYVAAYGSEPEQMTVKPESPVRPDKIVVPKTNKRVWFLTVDLKGKSVETIYIDGSLPDFTSKVDFLVFHSACRVHQTSVDYQRFNYILEDQRDTIIIAKSAVVYVQAAEIPISDYDKVVDLRDQYHERQQEELRKYNKRF